MFFTLEHVFAPSRPSVRAPLARQSFARALSLFNLSQTTYSSVLTRGARDVAMRKDRHDGASYRRLELITGSKRRRARSAREKAAIVAETFAPGANVSEIARRHGLNRGLLVTWRRQVRRALPGPVAEAASEGGEGQPSCRLRSKAQMAGQRGRPSRTHDRPPHWRPR